MLHEHMSVSLRNFNCTWFKTTCLRKWSAISFPCFCYTTNHGRLCEQRLYQCASMTSKIKFKQSARIMQEKTDDKHRKHNHLNEWLHFVSSNEFLWKQGFQGKYVTHILDRMTNNKICTWPKITDARENIRHLMKWLFLIVSLKHAGKKTPWRMKWLEWSFVKLHHLCTISTKMVSL